MTTREKVKFFSLKQKFKDSEFYKTVKLFLNEKAKNPNRRKVTLYEIKKEFQFEESVKQISADETKVELDKEQDTTIYKQERR